MKISGCSALVTGGGSGLGEATVRGLAEAGADVFVADVNAERAQNVATAVGGKPLVFERTLRINLVGSYTVLSIAARRISALAPVNEDGERGVVINTASVAYQDGQVGRAAYAASRAVSPR